MASKVADIIAALEKRPRLLRVFRQLGRRGSVDEIAARLGVDPSHVFLRILELKDLGLVWHVSGDEYAPTELGKRVLGTIEVEERLAELPSIEPSSAERLARALERARELREKHPEKWAEVWRKVIEAGKTP